MHHYDLTKLRTFYLPLPAYMSNMRTDSEEYTTYSAVLNNRRSTSIHTKR